MPLVELNASLESLDEMMAEINGFEVEIASGVWTIRCQGAVAHVILPAFLLPFVDDETRQMVREVLERALLQALGSTEMSVEKF